MLIMIKQQVNTQLLVNNIPVPTVEKISILGMWIQQNGRNTETINKLEATTKQTCRLLKRIAKKYAGMKDVNLLRLVHYFINSRVTYAILYTKTTKERDKVDILIRKGVKTDLYLPACTSTEIIIRLGVSNSLVELCEAKLTAKYISLTGSNTGRSILTKLYQNRESQEGITPTPKEIVINIRIPPIPTTMHLIHKEECRSNRFQGLQSSLLPKQGAVYTDAAEYTEGR
uniref:Uncharacterized protein n=1 Tax=Amblyomma maculatum TaxID=34609 RepID=G3MTT2_AMBMU